jgi:hypothetical protein
MVIFCLLSGIPSKGLKNGIPLEGLDRLMTSVGEKTKVDNFVLKPNVLNILTSVKNRSFSSGLCWSVKSQGSIMQTQFFGHSSYLAP